MLVLPAKRCDVRFNYPHERFWTPASRTSAARSLREARRAGTVYRPGKHQYQWPALFGFGHVTLYVGHQPFSQ